MLSWNVRCDGHRGAWPSPIQPVTTLQGELLARLSVAAAFAFLAMVYSGFVTDETNPTEVTMPAKPDHHVPVPAQVGLHGVPQDDSGA